MALSVRATIENNQYIYPRSFCDSKWAARERKQEKKFTLITTLNLISIYSFRSIHMRSTFLALSLSLSRRLCAFFITYSWSISIFFLFLLICIFFCFVLHFHFYTDRSYSDIQQIPRRHHYGSNNVSPSPVRRRPLVATPTRV